MSSARPVGLWLCTAIVVAAIASPAHAQSRDYAIPAGQLRPALDTFARQSGLQVIYRVLDTQGRRSRGARGRLTSAGALQSVLAGSGLTWRVQPSGAVAIVREAAPGSSGPADGQPVPASALDGGHENASPPAEIVVTGSRIVRADSTLPAMTITIGGDEIFHTGRTSLGDALNDLPATASTLTQSNSIPQVTGAGLNMLDLRGLGLERTLVLQNGRRHIAGAPFTSGVDVNTIPSALIDRIEIVSGGSSAVYGSDAVAGVVNFILKRDFEGFEVRGQAGVSQHGDAGQQFASLVAGTNVADGRGNATLSIEAAHQDDWYASQRARYRKVSAYLFSDIDEPNLPNGSDNIPDRTLFRDQRAFSSSNGGSFVDLTPGPDGNVVSYLFQPDGTLIPQTGARAGLSPYASFNGGNGTNLREGRLMPLAPDVGRVAVNLLGHFTVSNAFEPFVEAKYVRLRSDAAMGSFFSVGLWSPRERYRTDNPFLTSATRDFIRSTLGLAPAEESSFYFRRNFAELGPLTQKNLRETYRLVGGARGRLAPDWSYEASVNVARSRTRTDFTGNVNVQRFLLAIDAARDPVSGHILCRSQIDPAYALALEGAANPDFAQAQLARDVADCVPLNPFGEGNISESARAYLLAGGTIRSTIKQVVLNGFVAGDSGQWFALPGGPVGLALGGEYRRETYGRIQDELTESGLTHVTFLPPFEPPAFKVGELFGEIRLPIAKDRPFFEELTLSGAGRLAHYRGTVGTVFAWNLGGQWAPLRDVRLRMNRSRAVRAPNLFELYQPVGQNFTNNVIRDPCSIQNIGAGSSTREANCHADGVPAGFSITYPVTFGFIDSGNPDLHEERSDSLTLGLAVQPRSVPGLSLSVDYYDIRVKDVITSPMAQSIIDSCYDAPSLENAFCELFDRNQGSGSGPHGEMPGEIIENSLRVLPLNYAALKVRGFDVQATYRRTIPAIGTVNSRLLYTLALQNDSYLDPSDPKRRDQNLLELGNPRHALNWDVGLRRGPLTLGYQFRYLSRMSIGAIEDIRSVQGRPPEDADAFPRRYFRAATYHNARVEWDIGRRLSAYAGIDNIADRPPPPTLTGVTDAGAIYDNIGRFFYLGAVARF